MSDVVTQADIHPSILFLDGCPGGPEVLLPSHLVQLLGDPEAFSTSISAANIHDLIPSVITGSWPSVSKYINLWLQTQLSPHLHGTASALLLHFYLYRSYLWQYHSPWQREHLFAASFPQHPHFGFSGSKLSITSKLYVWANLVQNNTYLNNNHIADGLSWFAVVPSVLRPVFSVLPLGL